MCGRYALFDAKDFGPRFNLATNPQFVAQDRYNVAPGQRLPVVIQKGDQRQAEIMQWGFVPVWAKDPTKGLRPINTKAESVFVSPMWRQVVKNQRCLVPARGFYEWQQVPEGHKIPYYIHPINQKLFAFAGLYSIWHDAENYPLLTFSIITTTPNKQMQPIHNRMPVILEPSQEALWLEPSQGEPELKKLLAPYEDEKLAIYRVSEDVNSARVDDAHLVAALSE